MSLTLKTRFCGNVFIIQCSGRIMAGQESLNLETVLNEAEHEFALIVLNLADVSRMDSMGLGLLVRHGSRLNKRGGSIRFASAQPFITHLLKITNLTGFLQNYSTEEEAIASFRTRPMLAQMHDGSALRRLVFDPSADFCAFIQSALAPHGFNVKTTCSFRDAKTLLRVEPVDCILVGPGTPQLSSEDIVKEFTAIAPDATMLTLTADFKSHDAGHATTLLHHMFGIGAASPLEENPCP